MIGINSRTRWLAAFAVAALTVLAVACGGDSADDSSESENFSTNGGSGELLNQFDGDAREAISDGAAGEPPSGAIAGAGSVDDGADSAPGGALPALLDRKVIFTATLSVETDAVSQRFEDAGNIAASLGGMVASSSFGSDGDRQTASITIRVPTERYAEAIVSLRKLGDVRSEQSTGTDVTEEYTDLASRLRNLEATEAQYLALLARADNITDILTVQDRVNAVRAQIEQVQGRIQLLGNQTDLATITTHLVPPPVGLTDDSGAGNPLEVAVKAFEASLVVLLGIATGVLAIAAFSWWLIPLAAAGIYFGRRQLRASRDSA